MENFVESGACADTVSTQDIFDPIDSGSYAEKISNLPSTGFITETHAGLGVSLADRVAGLLQAPGVTMTEYSVTAGSGYSSATEQATFRINDQIEIFARIIFRK